MAKHSGINPVRRNHHPLDFRNTVRDDSIAAICRELGPVIYSLKWNGYVKIGHTRNMSNRFRKYGVSWGQMLSLIPGTIDDEMAIHARLAPHVAQGREYYYPVPEVLEAVNEMRLHFGHFMPPLDIDSLR